MKKMHDYLWPDAMWHYWTERRFKAHCAGHKFISYAGGAGTSKAQPLWAKVLTPMGYRTIGSLKIGDEVCTPDGGTTKVKQIHEQGIKKIFKITFSDRTSTYCCEDHLWNVKNRKDRDKGRGWRTLSTKEITPQLFRRLSIPVTKPVNFAEQPVPIEPYTLGILLGNGCFNRHSCSITLNGDDLEIVEKIKQHYEINKIHTKKGHNAITFSLKGMYRLIDSIGQRGHLSNSKYVPTEYLYNSVEVRTKVLQGLLDTDGTPSGKGARFSSVSKQLADDVTFLAQSLGFVCCRSVKKTSYKKNGITISCQDSYAVHIRYADGSNLFSLKRKKDKVSKGKAIFHKTIESIEPFSEELARCITLASDDGLYLTNDFIVTHNSFDAAKIALLFWFGNPNKRTVVVASTSLESLDGRIWGYITKLIGQIKLDLPYNILQSKPPKIINKTDTSFRGKTKKDTIHGIFAVAAKRGDDETAISNWIGRHPDEALLVVLDEATDMPPALLGALPNLDRAPWFQCVAIGNSLSKFDIHGALSTPKNGWDSIDPLVDTMWETTQDRGICLFFSCYESPAIWETDEERRALLSKFLITAEEVESKKKVLGEKSDSFWRFVLGFWRSEATEDVVISSKFLDEFSVYRAAEFSGAMPLSMCAGLDVAFSTGGDDCILRLGIIGQHVNGKIVIDFRKEELIFKVPIMAVGGKSAELQIAEFVLDILGKHKIPLNHLAIDATGQGRAVGEVIKLRAGSIYSPLKIYSTRGNIALNSFDVIVRTRHELWFAIRDFIQNQQIFGIDNITAAELTTRLVLVKNGKQVLEDKHAYKTRMGAVMPSMAKSPDRADALSLCLQAAMIGFGFHAGQSVGDEIKQGLRNLDLESIKMWTHQKEEEERRSKALSDVRGADRIKFGGGFNGGMEKFSGLRRRLW